MIAHARALYLHVCDTRKRENNSRKYITDHQCLNRKIAAEQAVKIYHKSFPSNKRILIWSKKKSTIGKKNCLHQDSIIRTNVRESSNIGRDMKMVIVMKFNHYGMQRATSMHPKIYDIIPLELVQISCTWDQPQKTIQVKYININHM